MASLYEEELAAASDGGGFQVYPKKSTPHLDCISTDPLDGAKALSAVCARCGEDEVWICLQCHAALCSRYKNGCAKKHAEESNHHIAVSLSDLSVWDFGQDWYLDVIDDLAAKLLADRRGRHRRQICHTSSRGELVSRPVPPHPRD